MGLCSSCGQSKDRFKDKSSKICGQIHSAVTPLHSHEVQDYHVHPPPNCIIVNGHLPTNNNIKKVQQTATGTTMATSFPNMNITNPIKKLVSKQRNRYKQDGFNLDLTYITPNIIAMGYPASNIEGVYRNHIDDVVKMLEKKHNNHYFIYNLCSERCYDKSKFHNRVKTFPFDDHNPPKMELIQPFCQTVHDWLSENPENVAAVHCKAGKGRTGTMICCYLLHSGMYPSADEALSHYGQTRTQDRKGVTIPSQVRYVRYYEKMVRDRFNYRPIAMNIKQIQLQPAPNFPGGQGYLCFSISQQNLRENVAAAASTTSSASTNTTNGSGGSSSDDFDLVQKCQKLYKSGVYEVKKGVDNVVIDLDFCLVLSGDIKIEFFLKSKIGMKERQFQFWFNTFFVYQEHKEQQQQKCGVGGGNNGTINSNEFNGSSNNGSTSNNACDDVTYVLRLKKNELDIVNKKDKQNKVFSADFQLTLLLQKVPKDQVHSPTGNANANMVGPPAAKLKEQLQSDDASSSPNYHLLFHNYHHHHHSHNHHHHGNHENRQSSVVVVHDNTNTPSESSEAESTSEDSAEESWESVLDGDGCDDDDDDERLLVDPRGVGYRILSECELASQLTTTSATEATTASLLNTTSTTTTISTLNQRNLSSRSSNSSSGSNNNKNNSEHQQIELTAKATTT